MPRPEPLRLTEVKLRLVWVQTYQAMKYIGHGWHFGWFHCGIHQIFWPNNPEHLGNHTIERWYHEIDEYCLLNQANIDYIYLNEILILQLNWLTSQWLGRFVAISFPKISSLFLDLDLALLYIWKFNSKSKQLIGKYFASKSHVHVKTWSKKSLIPSSKITNQKMFSAFSWISKFRIFSTWTDFWINMEKVYR